MKKEMSLKNIVGKELLNRIQSSYLNYLESSAAIYEIDGDYATTLSSSKYCDFLNQTSRKLGGATDEEALKSGRWICHNDCWAASSKAIKDRKPCEMECSGGIMIYAVPIIVHGMVIGSNNAGVSNPPTDEKKINEIAQRYKVNPKELLSLVRECSPRPEYVLRAAKEHISTAAETIAEIFLRKQADEQISLHESTEEALREQSAAVAEANARAAILMAELEEKTIALERERKQLFSILDGFDEVAYVADPENYEVLYANARLRRIFGSDIIGKICYRALQNKEAPCGFCTNDKIFGDNLGKTYIWDHQNVLNKRWYHCIDRAIEWSDGKLVRCEVAIDITNRKETEEALNKKIEELEVFNKAAVGRELKMVDLKKEVDSLLRKLGKPEKYL